MHHTNIINKSNSSVAECDVEHIGNGADEVSKIDTLTSVANGNKRI